MTITAVLLVLAFILFLLAAVGWPESRINLVALGLAFATLAWLLGAGIVTR